MTLSNSKSSTHFQIQQSQPVLFLIFIVFIFLLFPFANSVSFAMGCTARYCAGGCTAATPSPDSAFFLSPYNNTIPVNSGGRYLALIDSSTALNYTENQIVAVEFDTYHNPWDPSMNHIGIDVNLIKSEAYLTCNTSLANNETANAWVNYNSTTQTLSVYLTYEDNPAFQGNYNLSYVVNLREVLPEWISVGFSAAAGEGTEIHNIVSWTFNSTLGGSSNSTPGAPPPSSTPTGNKTNLRLMVGLAVGIGVLICGVGLFWFMKWKQIVLRGKNDMDVDDSTDDDDDFEEGTGPRRFTFGELSHATNNFSEGESLDKVDLDVFIRGVK